MSELDPADCPHCGEWRDGPDNDCAACGYVPPAERFPRPCGDPLGLCVYKGPHAGDHKVGNVRLARTMLADHWKAVAS